MRAFICIFYSLKCISEDFFLIFQIFEGCHEVNKQVFLHIDFANVQNHYEKNQAGFFTDELSHNCYFYSHLSKRMSLLTRKRGTLNYCVIRKGKKFFLCY